MRAPLGGAAAGEAEGRVALPDVADPVNAAGADADGRVGVDAGGSAGVDAGEPVGGAADPDAVVVDRGEVDVDEANPDDVDGVIGASTAPGDSLGSRRSACA
ncbi:hypothetical protein [Streptomyces sp. PTD5-9]|uniref:hypothetical protein n=1 Tax=Streptomyces sp. PTD5-9 TaxID=3120150 RepID=UPI003009D3D9